MDSSTFSYPSTDLWKPVTSRSCKRRRGKPHSGSWFRVLQLGTRNPKLRTFTSSNHISQKHHLFAEDFHHRKQGLSPQIQMCYFTKQPDSQAKFQLFSESHPNNSLLFSTICVAVRYASAMIVSTGFMPPLLTCTEPSARKRFGKSQTLAHLSVTLFLGSPPIISYYST